MNKETYEVPSAIELGAFEEETGFFFTGQHEAYWFLYNANN
ncbi:hypothetical protein SAMN05421504_113163 [Amycolatopsis xylanica]|uniref:Lasso RiPP family leader peptide-containing protein n=1 Tax=Amycolatopsis xylanica TaxID=589385 RepID=A0A1H3SEK2_9PSEU|nr:keywimysin-related RiPP [Amycolatopsis xylanica]SDZ36334.1 hypothetical protein SAMN05421504_113163 [Amycolatopsis xylanica]